MRRRIFPFCIALLVADGAAAQQSNGLSQDETRALNNVQHEMMICYSYYQVMKQCAGKRLDAGSIATVDESIKRLFTLGHRIAQGIGLTEDAMKSRVLNSIDEHNKLIANNCMNVSSLLRRYAYKCKDLVENPDGVLRRYLDEK